MVRPGRGCGVGKKKKAGKTARDVVIHHLGLNSVWSGPVGIVVSEKGLDVLRKVGEHPGKIGGLDSLQHAGAGGRGDDAIGCELQV
jgi:hypothetical protein